MYLISLLFAQTLAFASSPCSIDRILANPKGEAVCVKQFTSQIDDEQDRAEFKYRLGQWKPNQNLRVITDNGFIDASVDGKNILRAVWLQRMSPALLWLDGKILSDKSNNPSVARTIDNLFRTKTASLFTPEAHAAGDESLAKSVLFFYSVSPAAGKFGSAEKMIKDQPEMAKFLPKSNFLNALFRSPPEVECADQKTIVPQTLELDSTSDSYRKLNITAKAPDKFLVSGIEKNVTHLITLNSFTVKTSDHEEQKVLHPEFSLAGSTISKCGDLKCTTQVDTRSFEDRDLVFGNSPETEAAAVQNRSKVDQAAYNRTNKEFQSKVAAKLFSMSVLGACCGDLICQEQLKKKYGVDMKPSTKGSESSAIRE